MYPGDWEAELLPPHYWTLELRSDGVPGTRDIWSALVVVWFTKYEDARPLLEQAAAGLRNLRWDQFAKGWDP